ncbi:asparagine synthase (glutamine-hydrolyzing) [Gluconacetobacter tumulisoli]|uniref:asparagine synthase (glutamine-hydrolyzing) n=1 Tax=Gluconacetobacter tumulisoli TaxID=1286189 RepID=A0A7W4K4M9_9PROT|nr:asparagine synthase (glutamine-hydrolyzing) [Gluconacetobacter tumulisoli]MBB2200330.1 asparagine synthase (glutamine-hydrolyzing) [Gluconacetobacter tumulisoli]
MCGIAGILCGRAATPPDRAVLERMVGALRHRGPDGSGIYVSGRASLLHTRLAIIDPAGGDQPICLGSAAMVANGEIYNDPQIRAALGPAHFRTGSDSESALHLWLRDGAGYAAGLRGMYAIAIHEQGNHDLVLSRDPFGIKPLYVAEIDGRFLFASEPSAILATGLVPRGLRADARNELLQLHFTTGRETIFPGISRVLPGETLRIEDGRILDRQRLSALPEGPVETLDEDAALARLDAALADSVSAHERSDVPFGMFLSGGIDSAAVLAAMVRLGGPPVQAWTAAFDAPGAADETAAAAVLAASVGADHRVLRIGPEMVWRDLPAIVGCMDDPVADYAIIPTWFLARAARQEVKVILSGEGGDELFAGYGRYRQAIQPWWRGGRRMRRRGTFDGLDVLDADMSGWRDGIAAAELKSMASPTRLAGVQATDIAEWLPNDLLLKLDRCLMAHGVEGRTPLLDPVVADAVYRLPDAMKIRGRTGKWLLRRWLEQAMPAARPFAPKQGFTVPVGTWIAAAGDRLGVLVARQAGVAEIARAPRVRALFAQAEGRRAQHAAWTLLFYALWHQIHIRGVPADGDVFAVLAA